jgi:Raf kinase inhibitor-like YbhB/YbcL family protein
MGRSGCQTRPVRFSLRVTVVAVILLVAACSNDGRTLAPASPEQTASIITTSTLPAGATFQLATPFGSTTPIQPQYTCEGDDVSPPMSWVAAPTGTPELALVVTDSDADGFVHWVIAGMDPEIVTEIREGEPPPTAVETNNDFGRLGWSGPCPPSGKTHSYVFTLYALSEPVSLEPGMDPHEAIGLIEGASAAQTSVTAVFP